MKRLILIAILATGLLASQRSARAADERPSEGASSLTDIRIVYQLDPRLTRGLHMGERWVLQPTYVRVGEAGQEEVAVEVRVKGVDGDGKLVDISPEWATTNPKMVTVEPSGVRKQNDEEPPKTKHAQYTIKVLSAGECGLRVSSEDFAKVFLVKATKAAPQSRVLKVEITSQDPQKKDPQP